MTRWEEDPTLEAPDGHRWMRPAPDDCPNCPCHTARVCTGALWSQATPPANPDGTPYTEPCPCERAASPPFRPCADCRTPFTCEDSGEDRCP